MRLDAAACLEVAYLMRKSRLRLARQNTLLYDLIYVRVTRYVRARALVWTRKISITGNACV